MRRLKIGDKLEIWNGSPQKVGYGCNFFSLRRSEAVSSSVNIIILHFGLSCPLTLFVLTWNIIFDPVT